MTKWSKLSQQEDLQCNGNDNWKKIIRNVPKVNTGCQKVWERTEYDNDSPKANTRLQRAHKEQLLYINGKPLQPKMMIIASVNAVMDKYQHLIKHPKKKVWNTSVSIEIGRLAQEAGG